MPTTSSTFPAIQEPPTDGSPRRGGTATVLAYLALACALVGAAVLLWAPLTTTTTARSSSSGEVSYTVTHGTLLESEGSNIVAVLSIPVLLTLVGIVPHRRVRMATAILLVIGCLVGLASVGLFFVPSAVLAVVASMKTPKTASA